MINLVKNSKDYQWPVEILYARPGFYYSRVRSVIQTDVQKFFPTAFKTHNFSYSKCQNDEQLVAQLKKQQQVCIVHLRLRVSMVHQLRRDLPFQSHDFTVIVPINPITVIVVHLRLRVKMMDQLKTDLLSQL